MKLTAFIILIFLVPARLAKAERFKFLFDPFRSYLDYRHEASLEITVLPYVSSGFIYEYVKYNPFEYDMYSNLDKNFATGHGFGVNLTIHKALDQSHYIEPFVMYKWKNFSRISAQLIEEETLIALSTSTRVEENSILIGVQSSNIDLPIIRHLFFRVGAGYYWNITPNNLHFVSNVTVDESALSTYGETFLTKKNFLMTTQIGVQF